jgi:hypothetical protein
VKPYFTFLGLSLFLFLCIVYIKTFGYEEFSKWFMTQAMNYAGLLAAGGIIADIVREARS